MRPGPAIGASGPDAAATPTSAEGLRVKLDRGAALDGPVDTRADAEAAERDGFDGFWLSEVKHDPFAALAVAEIGRASCRERV